MIVSNDPASTMAAVNILTFGVTREIIGKTGFRFNGAVTTEDLRSQLEAEFPALKNIHYAIAVDKQLVTGPAELKEDTTIALLPPFSGG